MPWFSGTLLYGMALLKDTAAKCRRGFPFHLHLPAQFSQYVVYTFRFLEEMLAHVLFPTTFNQGWCV